MKILVPLDGSAASGRALSHAIRLAEQRADAMLILVNVQNADILGLSDTMVESREALAAQKSEQIFRTTIVKSSLLRTRYETRSEYGPVAETIDHVARESGADQIVMGTRGLGRVRGLLLGSVATQVVHLSDVPVTLVKERRADLHSRARTPEFGKAAAVA